MKNFRETFVVLDDPQPFDVLLSDDFIRRNNLMVVNEKFFPLRKLTKGMLLITSQNQRGKLTIRSRRKSHFGR